MGKGQNPVDTTKGPKSRLMLVQLIWSLFNSLDQQNDIHNNQRSQALALIDRYMTEYKTRFAKGATWAQAWQQYFKEKRT